MDEKPGFGDGRAPSDAWQLNSDEAIQRSPDTKLKQIHRAMRRIGSVKLQQAGLGTES